MNKSNIFDVKKYSLNTIMDYLPRKEYYIYGVSLTIYGKDGEEKDFKTIPIVIKEKDDLHFTQEEYDLISKEAMKWYYTPYVDVDERWWDLGYFTLPADAFKIKNKRWMKLFLSRY